MSEKPTSEVDSVVSYCEQNVQAFLGDAKVDWFLMCGSGMGNALVSEGVGGIGLDIEREMPLAELGLPAPSVEGHGNALVLGTLGDSQVVVQTGRIHPYEGHDVRVGTAAMHAVLQRGCGAVALTCAVGGLVPRLRAGQLVLLRDQINLFGPTPLVGAQFIDCSQVYDPTLRSELLALAAKRNEPVDQVVYAHARGPQYETPAEVRALALLGGEIVGMSTTYEAIMAAAHGVPCCGVGVVTNVAGAVGLSHIEVQELAGKARARLGGLLGAFLSKPR